MEDDSDGDPQPLPPFVGVAAAHASDETYCDVHPEQEEQNGADTNEVPDRRCHVVVHEGMRIRLGVGEDLGAGEDAHHRHGAGEDATSPEQLPVQRCGRVAIGEQQPHRSREPYCRGRHEQ